MRTSLLCSCVAALALSPAVSMAAEYVNDPLTAGSFPGRGSQGGTFSDAGWTVAAGPDAIWYEIADALPEGRVEYTITGLSTATSLTGNDHDILTVYQAPTGAQEPVPYSPYFRNNDFKTFTRIFGSAETGHPPGSFKLEMAFCPRGEPWYHDTPCPAECDRSGIAYASGSPNDIGWDAAKSYRMGLAWSPGKVSFFRDGEELGSVQFSGTFAPKPLRVRFGSPRHDGVYPSQAFMPLGITIKDVLVTGTPGDMTAECSPAVPDAGADDATLQDAGPTAGSYAALADVTAASWETGVYPDVADLNAEGDASGNPTGVVYLRFPAVSGVLESAILQLHTADSSSAAGDSGTPCLVKDDTWQETTMTWGSRPAVESACAGASNPVDSDTAVEWDVSSLMTSGANLNLAIVSKGTNGVHYISKDAGDPGRAPRLIVKMQPGAGGSGGSAGAAGAGADASASGGAAGQAGLAGSGGNRAFAPSEDDSGCGCRVGSRNAERWAISVLAIAAVALLRGRWRKRSDRASIGS